MGNFTRDLSFQLCFELLAVNQPRELLHLFRGYEHVDPEIPPVGVGFVFNNVTRTTSTLAGKCRGELNTNCIREQLPQSLRVHFTSQGFDLTPGLTFEGEVIDLVLIKPSIHYLIQKGFDIDNAVPDFVALTGLGDGRFHIKILALVVGNRKNLELLLVFRFAGIGLAVLSHDSDLSIPELHRLCVRFVSDLDCFHHVYILQDEWGNYTADLLNSNITWVLSLNTSKSHCEPILSFNNWASLLYNTTLP